MIDTTYDSETIIKAITHEYRRNIIRILLDNPLTYTEIAHLLGFDLKKQSGKFNFHLKELVSANLVSNDNDTYQLTPKGKEVYYLLLDIERDQKIDPHGMMTALIRLDGHRQFWFFVSSLGIVGAIWVLMIGLLGLFALDGGPALFDLENGVLIAYGILLVGIGLVGGTLSLRYYRQTVNALLGERSVSSRLISTVFFLSIQWYLIRSRQRVTYLVSTFITLFGWFITQLSILLHIVEGIDGVGPVLYGFDIFAGLALLVSGLLLKNLYDHATTQEAQNMPSNN